MRHGALRTITVANLGGANGRRCLGSGASCLATLIGVPEPGTGSFRRRTWTSRQQNRLVRLLNVVRLHTPTAASRATTERHCDAVNSECWLQATTHCAASPMAHGSTGPGKQMMAAQLRSPLQWIMFTVIGGTCLRGLLVAATVVETDSSRMLLPQLESSQHESPTVYFSTAAGSEIHTEAQLLYLRIWGHSPAYFAQHLAAASQLHHSSHRTRPRRPLSSRDAKATYNISVLHMHHQQPSPYARFSLHSHFTHIADVTFVEPQPCCKARDDKNFIATWLWDYICTLQIWHVSPASRIASSDEFSRVEESPMQRGGLSFVERSCVNG